MRGNHTLGQYVSVARTSSYLLKILSPSWWLLTRASCTSSIALRYLGNSSVRFRWMGQLSIATTLDIRSGDWRASVKAVLAPLKKRFNICLECMNEATCRVWFLTSSDRLMLHYSVRGLWWSAQHLLPFPYSHASGDGRNPHGSEDPKCLSIIHILGVN